MVRLPKKTCFSIAETQRSPVIAKPLIFYQYKSQWDSLLGLELSCYAFAGRQTHPWMVVLLLLLLYMHYCKEVWSWCRTGAAVLQAKEIIIIIRYTYPPWTLPTLFQPIPLRKFIVSSERKKTWSMEDILPEFVWKHSCSLCWYLLSSITDSNRIQSCRIYKTLFLACFLDSAVLRWHHSPDGAERGRERAMHLKGSNLCPVFTVYTDFNA